MTTEELKQEIERRAGVPASLLTGENEEEIIARAKAILAYKKQCEEERPRTAAEQFTQWFRQVQGLEEREDAGAAFMEQLKGIWSRG